MIHCKICGHSVKYRLIEHIQKTHKISLEDYKSKYGNYISSEYIDMQSNNAKKVWKENTNYRENIITKRKITQNSPEWKEKQSNTIKNVYEKGFKNWNYGLTKETNISLKIIGEKNKKILTGRTKENYEYLLNHSNKMKSMWKLENSNMTYASKCLTTTELQLWKNKIRETIVRKILNGELNSKNNFNCGWYESKTKENFWYQSGLELNSMKYLDSVPNITWTNKHKIRIEYYRNDNSLHVYIPDFLIVIDNIKYIIEMKGYPDDNLISKQNAILKIYKNYKIIYSIITLESYINEIIENKINND
jgi:hypothetical protein